ncbi:MAG: hypothetical protein OEY80_04370 [Nitrospirota bacterium]|nr:hypothetical protein [Nitrospirota bacterium]
MMALFGRRVLYPVAGLVCMVNFFACAKTEWVKQGVPEGEVQQALRECQSLIMRPLVDPSQKFSPPPDTSSLQVDRCMKDKGFTRVKKGESLKEVEVLSTPGFPTPQ